MAKLAFKKKIRRTDKQRIQIGLNLYISAENEKKLVDAMKKRLEFGNEIRKVLTDRMAKIDKELGGYIILDKDDKERKKDTEKGRGPKPYDVNIQFVDAQIDEAVTYMLSVMAPDIGMYTALASKDKQEIAQGFAKLLNQQAEVFGHYAAYNAGFRDMFAYNIGGFIVDWVERIGNTLGNKDGGAVQITKEVVASGNEITALDMYNLIWDVSVHPTKLNMDGEFFATIRVLSKFKLQRLAEMKQVFGIKRFTNLGEAEITYFITRPDIRSDEGGTSGTDWHAILSAGPAAEIGSGFEEIKYYTWINPKDYGLSQIDELQIWQFTLINSKYIVAARFLDNAHGLLPINMATPIIDGLNLQTRSFAERLMPTQRFASFQLNIHQRAARKALYGLTIYDAQIIPLGEADDLQGGQIAAKPTGQDRDLRKSILFHNDTPDTSKTMDDIARADAIAQKLLPTDMQNQVASLERATQYQAAAVVQGSNRRNHKNSKLVNSQCMMTLRAMLMANVFQFQESVILLDDNGKEIEINPSQFRETKIEFAISDGLKGTDRLLVVESIKEILRFLLQSPTAAQQIDIIAVIDYWTDLLGDSTDFNQFKIESPLDALGPEEKQVALQLYQQFLEQQKGGGANAAASVQGTSS